MVGISNNRSLTWGYIDVIEEMDIQLVDEEDRLIQSL